MFEQSLLKSHPTRRGLTTTLSFVIEALVLAVLLLLPIFRNEALPMRVRFVHSVPAPSSSPPLGRRSEGSRAITAFHGALLTLSRIPKFIPDIPEQGAPSNALTLSFPHTSDGTPDGVPHAILGSSPPVVLPRAPSVPAKPIHVSGKMVQGLLIHQVKPGYPQVAKLTHTHGTVVLHALIARDGTITGLQVISGPPLLLESALNAVREWRYRPYTLNGEPVEVETFIEVHFKLSGD